jgi:hypothetical protein
LIRSACWIDVEDWLPGIVEDVELVTDAIGNVPAIEFADEESVTRMICLKRAAPQRP